MISIVFSAYNEENTVEELCARIVRAMSTVGSFEIVGVDNASTDTTRSKLLQIPGIKVVSLEKNRGQAAGLDAGIRVAKGDIICTLDADLQNDPLDIPGMLQKIENGYDVVVGWRKARHDNVRRRIFSRLANFVTSAGTGLWLHDYSCGIKTFKKSLLGNIRLEGVLHVFLPAILFHRGARLYEMPVRHHERKFGTSKYSVMRMSMYIVDLFLVRLKYLRPSFGTQRFAPFFEGASKNP